MTRVWAGRRKYFWVFAASGFSGLIYESIWTHYLKLFLGHAAYAQTLVLSIFMGGMAVGAWLCARLSRRWPNLLLCYAAAEGVVGLLALLFHPIFVATSDTMLSSILPALGPGVGLTAAKWGAGTALVLPQSILLGMTFPLMSAGVIRRYPDAWGGTISTLYFVNSLGGALGVLASGFCFVKWLGLPGTIALAGTINIALAGVVIRLSRLEREALGAEAMSPVTAASAPAAGGALGLMLLVAALTGLSSFFYEIGWIRMLSLVLGSATHSFELMLSAFILGLALGGLWIRSRIDRFAAPVSVLGWIQVAMGLCALATLPLYGLTFDLMAWLIASLPRTDFGYLQLNLAGHGIAAVIMLPAAMCAGMTLPLITHSLLNAGRGEKSIGLVYAANTVGAIAGVFAAVHFVMPALGLKNVILLGAAVDMALGVVLLARAAGSVRALRAAGAFVAAAAALLAAHSAVTFDLHRLSSGVYRSRQSLADALGSEVLFHEDGKTATVSVLGTPDGVVQIRTNGKADASINLSRSGSFTPDEVTATLLAGLPLLLRPQARAAANVGLGSGLTTQVLLAQTGLERVDTVEIEPAMVAGARWFLPRNRLAYEDPRGRITIEDAKTFFATRAVRYDIIASEPSNPWVSGVSSLFSREFHRLMAGSLAPGGIFAQWLQVYKIDESLVVSVIKSIDESFSDYAIYAANQGDLVIVATSDGSLPELPAEFPPIPELIHELGRVSLATPADIAMRQVGTKKSMAPLLATHTVAANSDFFPVLDSGANRARFLERSVDDLVGLMLSQLPLVEMLGEGSPPRPGARYSGNGLRMGEPHPADFAAYVRDRVTGAPQTPRPVALEARHRMRADKLISDCARPPLDDRVYGVVEIALNVVPFLAPADNDLLWRGLDHLPCAGGLQGAERDWLRLVVAVGHRDGNEMAAAAQQLLAAGQDRSSARRRYLLGAGMLGSITVGRFEEARKLWRRAVAEEFPAQTPTMFWRLLAAHAGIAVPPP